MWGEPERHTESGKKGDADDKQVPGIVQVYYLSLFSVWEEVHALPRTLATSIDSCIVNDDHCIFVDVPSAVLEFK